MTEAEYLTSTHLEALYSFIKRQGRPSRSVPGRRRLRLLACGFCRLLLWHLPVYVEAHRAVEAAENYADRRLTSAGIQEAWKSAFLALLIDGPAGSVPVNFGAMLAAAQSSAATVVHHVSRRALEAVQGPEYPEARRLLCVLLRDVFRYPSCPPKPLPAAVLRWEKGTVVKLAEAAYEQRAEPRGLLDATRLSVLADALEDAGCADPEIVSHLRSPEPHVRGCWAVDLVMGRS